jgi:transcriptional regulator with PAS, ATPase and Fis domain
MTQNLTVKKMLKKVRKFANADATVLIQGENGTGKEILAQGIHMYSTRREKPFIPINIASITPTLLESELFGYVDGAFTGAKKGGKPGIFEIANNGTLFIDEIGDAPFDIQARLLRVLQEKKVRRVGGEQEFSVDVRIISATNKNLLKLVEKGLFRRDLFFRLNILPIKTIPLRKRREDIVYLLTHYIKKGLKSDTIELKDVISDEALKLLMEYSWDGNVREIMNIVEYIRYLYDGKPLMIDELPDYLLEQDDYFEKIMLDYHSFKLLEWISENKGIGRKRLHQLCIESNIKIGEGKIRAILERFNKNKLITIGIQARGCVVTDLGFQTLKQYD